jgi:hypothetical protein
MLLIILPLVRIIFRINQLPLYREFYVEAYSDFGKIAGHKQNIRHKFNKTVNILVLIYNGFFSRFILGLMCVLIGIVQ